MQEAGRGEAGEPKTGEASAGAGELLAARRRKLEALREAGVDPWRRLSELSDGELVGIVEKVRPRMDLSARKGPIAIESRVYRLVGRPCPRCGERILSRGQGDANRATYWCPGCQK